MEGNAKKSSVLASVVRLGAALLLFLLALGLAVFAAWNPQWVADIYLPFSRTVCGGLAACVSFLPLSAAELLCYLLVVWAVVFFVRTIVRVVRGPGRGASALRFVSYLLLLAAILAALFFSLWGLNYYAPPLAERMGLPAPDLSAGALRETTQALAEELNAMAGSVPRDENGVSDLGTFAQLAPTLETGFLRLFQEEEVFGGCTLPAKRVLNWPLLSWSGINGIFIPFTGECNVNPDTPSWLLPNTMAHEMAHRLGTAPEQEANFVAYLACTLSDDIRANYSGAYSAFVLCYNALADTNLEALRQVYSTLDPRVQADIRAHREHNQRYEGPVREAATQINDTYLKNLNQSQGVESYGQAVDLILAWRQQKAAEPPGAAG